jgi:hypothetical protein
LVKFHCDTCKKELDRCQCPDLEQRFKERFWGSVLEKQAEEAVEASRVRQKRGRRRHDPLVVVGCSGGAICFRRAVIGCNMYGGRGSG